MAAVPTLPPPGWYHDPYLRAGLRWWDGVRWAQDTRPLPGQRPPTPVRARVPAQAGRNERIGRLAMLLWAPLQLGYTTLLAYAAAGFLQDVVTFVEQAPDGQPPPLTGDSSFALFGAASLGGLVIWIPQVLLMVWAYRCATAAAALGLPAAYEPVWAVVGWVVPVINFWFPYLSVRDCLPPRHPARPEVLRWWAGYLGSSLFAAVLILLALAGPAAFLAGVAVQALIVLATALSGLRVTKAVDEAHRKLLPQA